MTDAQDPSGAPTTPPPPAWDPAPPPGSAAQYGAPVPTSSPYPGVELATPWVRLGAALLNGLLLVVTLVVGYLVWTVILWNQGTNPGKKILGLKIVNSKTGETLTWGGMFVRNFLLGYLVIGLLSAITFGIFGLVDYLMIFGAKRQRLLDRWASTLVVKI